MSLLESARVRAGYSPGPKPKDSEIDAFGLTHPGKVRKENQDHFLLCQLRKQIHVQLTSLPDATQLAMEGERLAFLAMVADGVGGGPAGEEASRLALEAITRYVAEATQTYYGQDSGDDRAFSAALAEAAKRCHKDLLKRASQESRPRMATTLTLLIGVWPSLYLVQVGDSRYYLLKQGELIQVSRDQTIAQDLIDQGAFSRAEAARTSWMDVLSSAIGGSTSNPVVTRIDNDRSYVHLICSDGLTKHVPDARIAERLREMSSAEQVCESLLQDALDGGGTDNVTIVVARARPAQADT